MEPLTSKNIAERNHSTRIGVYDFDTFLALLTREHHEVCRTETSDAQGMIQELAAMVIWWKRKYEEVSRK